MRAMRRALSAAHVGHLRPSWAWRVQAARAEELSPYLQHQGSATSRTKRSSTLAEGGDPQPPRPESPPELPPPPTPRAAADDSPSRRPAIAAESAQQKPPAAPRVANLPADFVPPPPPEPAAGGGPAAPPPPAVPLPYFATRIPTDSSARRRDPPPLPLLEAIRAAKAARRAKFDETLEAHVRLSVDPKRSDQIVRGAVSLPWGTGKAVRVAVFADGAAAEEARAAGAEVVGAEDLISRVKESGGKLDFDKCIATPGMMKGLGQVARILGPRGLMPNPKLGTVTKNVGEAVRAAKQGRVDFRADKTGIVHAGLGKLSFSDEALQANVAAFAAAMLAAKPAGLKKSSRYAGYFTSFALASTMGPGVRVQITSVANAADDFSRQQGA